MNTRLETDSIGSLSIPIDAYYGINSFRAKRNFPITGKHLCPEFIISLAQIKKAAAMTNLMAQNLDATIAQSIIIACDEIIQGHLHDQFIVDPIQGGAGTSSNMNANEVIANRAIELLGGTRGEYTVVNPNDHVNCSQSTNDVIPTAGKLTVLKLLPAVLTQLERLHHALNEKALEFASIIKVGRTQMQDAVPIFLGQSFHAYSSVVQRDIQRVSQLCHDMNIVNLGGTAIGTAVNVSDVYLKEITNTLSQVTGETITHAPDLIDSTQNLDGFVTVSANLRTCAITLSKIANDLRLMSSGPRAGLGEINLPPQQNGSSIMPGKINPVIPEVVTQVAFNIIGNDTTITLAAEAGQLELNAFEPIIFYNLFESLQTLAGAIKTFVDHCIVGITANEERCLQLLDQSVATVTALCPYLGYKKSTEIAKQSLDTGETVSSIVLRENLMAQSELEQLLNPLALAHIDE